MPDALLKIAVDAMGGDYAPREIVRGVLAFLRSGRPEAEGVELLLVGDTDAIQSCLDAEGATSEPRLRIVHTRERIAMDEHPMESVRKKPDSSIAVCAALVKRGEAHATLSAGNTGACLVAAILLIGRLNGIARPPIATLVPTTSGEPSLLVDAGANVDCQPSHLAEFALLGSLYVEHVFGVKDPRVALLSNGEESSKGDELVRRAWPLIEELPVNFIGAVEGNHFPEGRAHVLVCDGFVGNVMLKTAEGMGDLAIRLLEKHGAPAEAQALLRSRIDWAEFGGAPLLGIDGISLIAHGRSNARAIVSALTLAARAARADYVGAVKTALEGMPTP